MNEQQQAEVLAAWLAAGGTQKPDSIDQDVQEALYALRPDLAPPPRVRIDDILASVRTGPLAAFPEEQDAVAPAAPYLVAVVEVDDEDDVPANVVPFPTPAARPPVERVIRQPIPVASQEPSQRNPRFMIAGAVGLAAAAGALFFVLPSGDNAPSAAPSAAKAVAAAPAPVVPEAEPIAEAVAEADTPEEDTPEAKATVADAKALAAAAKSASSALDGLLEGVGDAVVAGDVDQAGAPEEELKVEEQVAAAPPPPPPPATVAPTAPLGGAAGNTYDDAVVVADEAERKAPAKASAASRAEAASAPIAEAQAAAAPKTDPAALSRARRLEAQIKEPADKGQKAAADAAQAALEGGDAAYALRLIEKGLALGGEGSAERARLEALRATARARL